MDLQSLSLVPNATAKIFYQIDLINPVWTGITNSAGKVVDTLGSPPYLAYGNYRLTVEHCDYDTQYRDFAVPDETILKLELPCSSALSAHSALTGGVHNFNALGDAPAQVHDNSRHNKPFIFGLDYGTVNIYETPTSPPLITHAPTNLACVYAKHDSNVNSNIWTTVSEVGSTGITTGIDKVAIYGGAIAKTGCNNNMFASNFLATINPDAGANAMAHACEFNINANKAGSWATGIDITNGTVTGGSTNTTAIIINKGYGNTLGWGTGIWFNGGNGNGVLGTLIYSDFAIAGRGIDMQNTTFSDYAIMTPGFYVGPNGETKMLDARFHASLLYPRIHESGKNLVIELSANVVFAFKTDGNLEITTDGGTTWNRFLKGV